MKPENTLYTGSLTVKFPGWMGVKNTAGKPVRAARYPWRVVLPRIHVCTRVADPGNEFKRTNNTEEPVMQGEITKIPKEKIDQQRETWTNVFAGNPNAFGEDPSEAAKEAAKLFKEEGIETVLELGGGAGRDAIFFAQNGFRMSVLDFTESSVETITQKALSLGLSQSVTAMRHDVRNPLPFGDESFDACYSFGLYSAALLTSELVFLSGEVRRVLKPGGLNIYSVRNTDDPHYGTGIHHGGDMWEVGPFIVHFFSRDKVNHLAKGYEIIDIDEFEEGDLPRKLFRVTMRKK